MKLRLQSEILIMIITTSTSTGSSEGIQNSLEIYSKARQLDQDTLELYQFLNLGTWARIKLFHN